MATSRSSHLLVLNLLFIVAAVLLIVNVEYFTRVVYPYTPRKIDYSLRNSIDKRKPDILLLGSSVLSESFGKGRPKSSVIYLSSKDLLPQNLKNSTGKDFKITVFWKPHMGGSVYWYLILRNQIAGAFHKDMSVGIAFTDDDPTSLKDVFKYAGQVKRQLNEQEDIYTLKKNTNFSVERDFKEKFLSLFNTYKVAGTISKDTRLIVADAVFKFSGRAFPQEAFDKRFNAFNFLNKTALESDRYDFNFDKNINETMWPEIIELKNKYNINLFVMIYPTYLLGDEKDYSQRKLYYGQFKKYAEANGIKFISLWDTPELQDQSLYRDTWHLKEFDLFNKLLAKALVDQGIAK